MSKKMSEEDAPMGIMDCPECGKQSVDEDTGGTWICHEGCDLSDYHFCPKCGELYQGRPGYCDVCIHEI